MGGRGPCPPCTAGHLFPGDLHCSTASTGSRWVGRDGTQTEQHWGREVRLCPHGPVPHFPGAGLPWGWCWAEGDGQHRRRWARARGSAAPQGWLQPCRPMALLLAGWSTAFVAGDVLGRAQKMHAGRCVNVFCARLVVLLVDESQFPTQSPGPQPRGGDRCAFLQCFSVTFLCVHQRPPSKKAPRGCIFFHAIREGCGTGPGENIVYAARCQPRAILATLQLWKSCPESSSHPVPRPTSSYYGGRRSHHARATSLICS